LGRKTQFSYNLWFIHWKFITYFGKSGKNWSRQNVIHWSSK